MRQRRWLELVKDYNCEILYHPGKANVVSDALSRKVSHLAALITRQAPLYRDFERAEIAVSRRLCVPADSALKTELLAEAHSSPFSMHLGLPRTLRGFTVIWVVVDRLTKSSHFIPGKSTYTTSKWAQLYMSGIVRLHGVPVSIVSGRDARFTFKLLKGLRLLWARVFNLPLTWHHLRPCPTNVVDPLFVEMRLIPERIGLVAYRLTLPPSLSAVHDVFHVSMLRKYVSDPSHVVDYEPLEIDENLSYTEQPVEVLARKVKMLRNREIPLVKVLWRNHKVEEAIWERQDGMRARYLELFEE
ncbi:pol protein [Cucumis melo var. makuwa]|uniref:Pol protein n=1 Tax=Cucumis melo var. makuwa TaxID=1194695 RepID=A0A5D3BKV5_CUCMM|nr:pol protein [Cucumis melo var. makuwa]TYJ99786.1 pol protein [Cucumis melo var. makuwa]